MEDYGYGPGGSRRPSAQKFGPDGRPLGASELGPDGRKTSGGSVQYGPDGRPLGEYGYGPDGRKTSGGSGNGYGPDGSRKHSGNSYGPDGRRISSDGVGPDGSGYRKGSSGYGPDGRPLNDYGYGPDGSRRTSANDGRKASDGSGAGTDRRPGSRSELRSPHGGNNSRSNSRGGGEQRFPPVELSNIPLPSTGGEVEAVVHTPSGGLAYPYVEDNGNGSIGLSYQPTERGPHSVDVRYDGAHVQVKKAFPSFPAVKNVKS